VNIPDLKLLWGRAAGICSKPGCGEDLTALVERGAYVVGEMAHVIARKPAGPRGTSDGGSDRYDNLILLCPTHHRHIDKAPEGTYSEDLLREWKTQHEDLTRNSARAAKYTTRAELRREVSRLLAANRALFEKLGPHSEGASQDPMSNMFSIWQLRRLDRILPNNRRILNVLDANANLLTTQEIRVTEEFRVHAEAYEHHVFDRLDKYPTFPRAFEHMFTEI
jgi:hypothetical protein